MTTRDRLHGQGKKNTFIHIPVISEFFKCTCSFLLKLCVLCPGSGLFFQETLVYQLRVSSQPGLFIRVGCPSWSLTTH